MVVGLYNGVFNNFLYEILGITKSGRGWIEFPRELPGLLLFVLLALLSRFSEMRLIRLAFTVAAAGLAGLFFFGESKAAAVIMLAIYSTGEHMMMPVRQSVGLHMARSGKEGLAMGVLRSFGNAGQAAGYYIAPLILIAYAAVVNGPGGSESSAAAVAADFGKYRAVFFVAFVLLIIGLVVTSFVKKEKQNVSRKRIQIERKFLRYYILEVFFGARKQVFLTFAPYVLITVYGAGPELISVLYGIWSLINIFIGPLIGRLIDRYGYKKVLIFDSFVLIIVCLFYGFAHRIFPQEFAYGAVCTIFVLDAIMFAFGMARDMYARSLAESKEEVTTTLATGLSMNHLISIVIAIFGGVLWQNLGIEYLFSFAAVLGIGSLIFSALLQSPEKLREL